MRILIVEDNERIAETVADVLEEQHYIVDIALDGEAGWQQAEAFNYDLILLDLMLPKLDGISLCQRLRTSGYGGPILVLTARDSSADKIVGLDSGADDYVVKPFDVNELAARVRALLRRDSPGRKPILSWGELKLDPSTLAVTYASQPVNVTSKEYQMLELLLRNRQRIFSQAELLDRLWEFEDMPNEEVVRAHIKRLRQKLTTVGAPKDVIQTVHGLGYRLKEHS
jgi:DNA-binding response OmpR family regulator